MTFQVYSQAKRSLIEDSLRSFLHSQKEEVIPNALKKQEIIESLEEFVFKGKLIRGTLFLLTIELLGGEISKEHIDIACAIELVHSALLIQDDIIDNDLVRRGGKTIYAVYEAKGRERKAINPKHFGISIAILVADVAMYLAMELISNFSGSQISKLLKYFSHEIKIVALAEGIDSEFGQTPEEATREAIQTVYTFKTARYTFSMPFAMACIVMQVDEPRKKEFEKLGELVGTIFQIKDDTIGLMGEESVIGKPIGSDVRENKKTLIRYLLLKKVNPSEKEIISKYFGDENLTVEQLEYIKELIKKYQIIEELNRTIEATMEQAWTIFTNIEGEESFKDTLKSLLEFNLRRSY